MTVGELIERLGHYDPEADVFYIDSGDYWAVVGDVTTEDVRDHGQSVVLR